MNSRDTEESQQRLFQQLQETLEEDLTLYANLQVKISHLRRNVETRSRTDDIAELQELKNINVNIIETRAALKLLNENSTPRQHLVHDSSPTKSLQLRIPPNLPVFDVCQNPSNFDINDFIELFEARCEGYGISSEHWSSILLSTVPADDMPSILWIIENILNLKWDIGKMKIIDHYSSVDIERKFNNMFLCVKMTEGENNRHFSDKFLFIVKKAKSNSNSALVRDKFLHAIPEHIKNQVIVASTKCSTSDELTTLVISVDSVEKSMKQFSKICRSTSEKQSTNQNSNELYCSKHGFCKHKSSECMVLRKENSTNSHHAHSN